MHRFSVKRLSAWILAVGACLALSGSVLLSAQGAQASKTKVRKAASAQAVPAPRKWAGATRPGKMQPKGAPQVTISGEVTDGSGGGWHLYARLEFTSDSTDPLVLFTNPVTGDYSGSLFDGLDYTVTITAVGPGYNSLRAPITTAGAPIIYDASLAVEGLVCDAPGFLPGKPTILLSESFDAGTLPAGWAITNDSGDGGLPWTIFDGADPCDQFPGNDTGGSGPYALGNSNCDGFVTDDTSLITPSIDMTGVANPFVSFATEYVTCCGQIGDVDYSIDGGTTWTTVIHRTDADGQLFGPATLQAGLPGAANQADVRVRWRYQGNFAWWWQVDDIQIGNASCNAQEGGLIVGNVFDLNTDKGLAGATVAFAPTAGLDTTATTFDVPEDPNQPGGFYILFSGLASQPMEASLARYGADAQTAAVDIGDVVRQDFHLPAASLNATPSPVNGIADPGGSDETDRHAGQQRPDRRGLHHRRARHPVSASGHGHAAERELPARHPGARSQEGTRCPLHAQHPGSFRPRAAPGRRGGGG